MTTPCSVRRDDVLAILFRHSGDVRRFGVRSLALFGSVARDEGKDDSDVDVLVDFDGAATFDRYMGLKFFLEDLLGRRVDVVTRRVLPAEMRPVLEREAILVA